MARAQNSQIASVQESGGHFRAYPLVSLHDERNIPVPGLPDVFDNPFRPNHCE